MNALGGHRLPDMTHDTTFIGVSTVAIPVTDQDRMKSLLEGLGFETRFDSDLGGGFRWIEVAAPGAETSIAVVATGEGLPTGIDTGIRLLTPDARAAHERLGGLGLEVGELLDWETAPLMFSFTDHDGNRLYVSEAE